jgi:hypothetical protein
MHIVFFWIWIQPCPQDRFGVPLPEEDRMGGSENAIPGHAGVVKGLTAPAATYVPSAALLQGNGPALLRALDRELKHGLLHLVNRGLLPQGLDLTAALAGESNVLHTVAAPLLPAAAKFAGASSVWEAARVYGAASRADARHGVPPGMLRPRVSAQTGSEETDIDGSSASEADTPGSPAPVGRVFNASPENLARSAALLSRPQPAWDELRSTAAQHVADADVAADAAGDEGRTYEQLMDEHSGHFIVIRKGETLDNTPEFASFQRVCEDLWPVVASLLLQIEAICVQYDVPTATVNGRKLAALAEEAEHGAECRLETLLACIDNIHEVAAVLQAPGQRFRGPQGREAAAVVLQAYQRGRLARKVRSGDVTHCTCMGSCTGVPA